MYEPIKKLGQNFLSDPAVSYGMVAELGIVENDVVIEVGPGLGFLTDELAHQVSGSSAELYAVEIDERFTAKLENSYLTYNNVYVVNEDILDFLPKFTSEKNIKVIGSLPYYITSPILHAVIKMSKLPEICVLLVQKEVAKKVSALAPDASYLSSFVQAFYSVEYLSDIPKEKFNPVPKVDGGILKLVKKPGTYDSEFIEKLEGFLHRAFKNPRKMLNKAFSKEELSSGGINPTLRPQNLSAEEWITFYNKIHG